MKTRKQLPKALRLEILYRDHFICRDCGATYSDTGGRFEVHHVVPVSEGGKDLPENLITLCAECHLKRHSSGSNLTKGCKNLTKGKSRPARKIKRNFFTKRY